MTHVTTARRLAATTAALVLAAATLAVVGAPAEAADEGAAPASSSGTAASARAVLADRPTMLLTGAGFSRGVLRDAASPSRAARLHGGHRAVTTPDGGKGVDLDGRSGYLEVPDSPDLSIATTGQLTVEVLVRFDTLRGMPSTAGSSEGPMVHLLAKGRQRGDQEYALRLYDARSQRPNRLSAYAFNPDGGQGAGSYVQDRLATGTWTHLTAVYDERAGGDGWGTVRLYRDGVLRDVDSLGGDYRVRPIDGGSPLFVGGRPEHSLLAGAIGSVAVYPRALAPERIEAHAEAALGR